MTWTGFLTTRLLKIWNQIQNLIHFLPNNFSTFQKFTFVNLLLVNQFLLLQIILNQLQTKNLLKNKALITYLKQWLLKSQNFLQISFSNLIHYSHLNSIFHNMLIPQHLKIFLPNLLNSFLPNSTTYTSFVLITLSHLIQFLIAVK